MHYQLYVARRERRLKQKDMAKILGIHQMTYQRKESGIVPLTLDEAYAIANFLGMSVGELFDSSYSKNEAVAR